MAWIDKGELNKLKSNNKRYEDLFERFVGIVDFQLSDMNTPFNFDYFYKWQSVWVSNWLDRLEKEKEYKAIEKKIIPVIEEKIMKREEEVRRFQQDIENRVQFQKSVLDAQNELETAKKKAKKK